MVDIFEVVMFRRGKQIDAKTLGKIRSKLISWLLNAEFQMKGNYALDRGMVNEMDKKEHKIDD
jgi:hypothetical protein